MRKGERISIKFLQGINKFGFLKHQLEEALINIKQHENIEVKGLMTVLPQNISIKKTLSLIFLIKESAIFKK